MRRYDNAMVSRTVVTTYVHAPLNALFTLADLSADKSAGVISFLCPVGYTLSINQSINQSTFVKRHNFAGESEARKQSRTDKVERFIASSFELLATKSDVSQDY